MSKRRLEQNERELAFLLIQTTGPDLLLCQSIRLMHAVFTVVESRVSITSVYLKAAAGRRDLKVMQIKPAHVVSFQRAEDR